MSSGAACTVSFEQQHNILKAAAQTIFQSSKSTLANSLSVHRLESVLSLSQLDRFFKASKTLEKPCATYIGSVDGDIVVSGRIRLSLSMSEKTAAPSSSQSMPPTPLLSPLGKKAKRAYDDSAERAKAAVDAVRKRISMNPESASMISEDMLQRAEDTITALFRDVRGPNNEVVVESLGLSVAPSKAHNNGDAPKTASRPSLIIAARLAAGVAVSIQALRTALCSKSSNVTNKDADTKPDHPDHYTSSLPDGMLTTKVDNLAPEYRLPVSALTKTIESAGQRAMLLFSSVEAA